MSSNSFDARSGLVVGDRSYEVFRLDALQASYDVARLPNREIALATADVVQRRLGVDLGLPPDQPLPPAHSRLASEVARRVLLWATHQDPHDGERTPSRSRDSARVQ